MTTFLLSRVKKLSSSTRRAVGKEVLKGNLQPVLWELPFQGEQKKRFQGWGFFSCANWLFLTYKTLLGFPQFIPGLYFRGKLRLSHSPCTDGEKYFFFFRHIHFFQKTFKTTDLETFSQVCFRQKTEKDKEDNNESCSIFAL